ncbi:MAG: hypothetical protein DRQ55_10750 [Planctomycetota bacterium]|nr:MAG: hypothetical protein DRQ55_10750 [Planctomycetota bacterium]
MRRSPAQLPQRLIPFALVALLLALAVGLVRQGGAEPGQQPGSQPGPHAPHAASGSPHEDPSPPTARWPLLQGLRADRDAPRHPSDGGGRAWVEDPTPAVAGGYGRWTIVFEAGPLGVALGGVVSLQTSPFWRWSPAWVDPEQRLAPELRARRPGLTEVSCDAPGVELALRSVADGLVLAEVRGRALTPGERIRFVYGAGAALARADDFAERGSPFIVGVDGDGDGVRGLLSESPHIDVIAGAPAQLVATVSSVVQPDEPARLTLAVLDAAGNAGTSFEGALLLSGSPPGSDLPERVWFTPADGGVRQLSFRCPQPGVYRIVVEQQTEQLEQPGHEQLDEPASVHNATQDEPQAAESEAPLATAARPDGVQNAGLFALSNPLIVNAAAPAVLWGDLHGHSLLSDGSGTPEDWYRYARDVAALDFAALTDHDHWGFRFLDQSPELWQQIAEQVEAFHEPGRFVSLLGYEWTSWIHGHRHVLSFEERPTLQVLSSLDERYETPRQLWDALRGQQVLTFAHHSAGGPIATNWSYPPDPELEPVTEVVSVHGSSEGPDAPGVIYRPLAGNFVRDALGKGFRLGFVGSGDGHDGHPGLAQLANPTGSGGLVAVLTDDLTRSGIRAALSARRCYATSGARMILRASLDGAVMGSLLPVPEEAPELVFLVRGTAPLERVDVIRSGQVIDTQDLGGNSFDLLSSWTLPDLAAGEFVYLRVLQVDGQLGFTSPFFVQ